MSKVCYVFRRSAGWLLGFLGVLSLLPFLLVGLALSDAFLSLGPSSAPGAHVNLVGLLVWLTVSGLLFWGSARLREPRRLPDCSSVNHEFE